MPVFVCGDCRTTWTEDDLPGLHEASSNWSYSCRACGGKLYEFIDEASPEEINQTLDRKQTGG